jgi:hypothetical protein
MKENIDSNEGGSSSSAMRNLHKNYFFPKVTILNNVDSSGYTNN